MSAGRKLLLADDSVTIQKVVNLTFADEGIEVHAVGNGREAIDRLMEISPDLVMADVNMPGLNGYQVCEQIKSHEKFRNTPVILLVGSFEPFDSEEAQRVGADDYLTKPFQSIRQLVNKVTDLLESAGDPHSGAAAVSGFADTQEMEFPAASETAIPAQTENYGEEESNQAESESFSPYSDAGIDDEMIQTNNASSFAYDEAQKFASRAYVEESADDDWGNTQPLSADDLKEFDSPASYDADDDTSAAVQSPQPEESVSASDEVETSPEKEKLSAFASDYDIDDDDLLELPFDEDEFEEEEEIEPSSQAETTTAAAEENLSDAESQTSVTSAAATVTENDETVESSSTSVETESCQPQYEEETEESAAMTTQPAPDNQDETAAQTTNEDEQDQSAATASAVNSSSLAQLSPEMIDAIAQRVIEKLSENTVKEIAWEVVPQQADLIIKKMVEEKLKE